MTKDQRDVSEAIQEQGGNAKYALKDSVFGDLFSDKKYLRQLYLALHPEDADVTEDDLTDVTIKNVFLNGQYNDIGFLRKDRFIILLECQSHWSINIIIRIFLYLAETYQRYIQSHDMDLYGSRKVSLPEPELYMLFIGDRKDRPERVTLSEEYFNGRDIALDLKVNVLYGDDTDSIIGQYVTFTKVYDEQRKNYGATEQAVREAIRLCKDKNVLKEYLESREQEVVRIMSLLFDQDEIMRIHDVNLTAEVTENVTKSVTESVTKSVTESVTKSVTKQERENGIRVLVETCRDFGATITDTVARVVSKFGLTEQDAAIQVRKFW